MEENTLEVRNYNELLNALEEADNIIMKKYMNNIVDYEIKEIDSEMARVDINSHTRLYKLEKLVYNAEDNNQDKLMNVYNSLALCGGSLINIIISDGEKVDYYIGARTPNVNSVGACKSVLEGTFEGNFPGSKLTIQRKDDLNNCIKNMLGEGSDSDKKISFVSGIPAFRNKENKKENFVQGIDRVVDSMKGKKFALLTISDPISADKMLEIRTDYENLYSQLSPFVKTSMTYSETDSNSVAETITNGITNTIGSSISNTLTNSTSTSKGSSLTASRSRKKFFSITGKTMGESRSQNESFSTQEGTSSSTSSNTSEAKTQTKGQTDTATYSNGRTMQITLENHNVKDLLKKIEAQIERIDNSMDLGLWNTATYCIAEDTETSIIGASAMEAICRGDKHTVESFAVGTWSGNNDVRKIREYLKRLEHPVLKLGVNGIDNEINPSSLITGKELVIESGLPQKSVNGVPVTEMRAFARNVVAEECDENEEKIRLGKIYHMGKEESSQVDLQIESLSAHTLITGSTGSGKSNTVYQILNELTENNIKFLVIEPAKGEYKNIFGNNRDVNVFSTNEKFGELLKINPFAFPDYIHVLEHIDRLIEIFNVCWPMYAAMPAVLKDALLLAYENCGWDLDSSTNCYGEDVYPTFKDLLIEITEVINTSAYSEEVKSNYIGSLATRIKSLTNGINGKMFTDCEIPEERIFDSNTIVDLSRIGSTETKSLIMGILVMKLSEYRMAESAGKMNQPMKHITVLEEAHNLLKNTTSTNSNEEGGNIAGKSVEMISNSIAEMRTYGEGFIIVDQSPSAIDISAIRNTNTKIIMRLPEDNDRKQAGRSAALTDKQIPELAKLAKGVAVVYQNNWLDPVLCKINKAQVSEQAYVYSGYEKEAVSKEEKKELLAMLMQTRLEEPVEYDIDIVEEILPKLGISTRNRLFIKKAIEQIRQNAKVELFDESSFEILSTIVVDVLGVSEKISRVGRYGENCDLIQQELNNVIDRNVEVSSKELKYSLSQCMMRELVRTDAQYVELYSQWREFAVGEMKRVL